MKHGQTPETTQLETGDLTFSATVFLGRAVGSRPLVVCLHGFPDNMFSFSPLAEKLAYAGYTVVCPMLPGYTPENQLADRRYDMGTVSDVLKQLVVAIIHRYSDSSSGQPERPVHLVGHDWGAISGFALVNKFPRLFRSYTSLTIPYNLSIPRILRYALRYLPSSWYIQCFQLPVLPEKLIVADNARFIELLLKRWSPGWEMPADHLQSVKQTLQQPGVIESALGYYRSLYQMDHVSRQARRTLNDVIDVPSLLVRGERDGCIHESLWRVLDPACFKQALRIRSLPSGHFPQLECADALAAMLSSWFAEH